MTRSRVLTIVLLAVGVALISLSSCGGSTASDSRALDRLERAQEHRLRRDTALAEAANRRAERRFEAKLAAVMKQTSAADGTVGTGPCVYRDGGGLPDPACTPGAVLRSVTQSTIHRTICVRGWTSTVRPPLSVTEPQKYASMRRYGNAFGTSARAYEFDHLIPLELGGAPDDPRNLWPEPRHTTVAGGDVGSYAKDRVENSLRAAVCDGTLTLAAARRMIRRDWITAVP